MTDTNEKIDQLVAEHVMGFKLRTVNFAYSRAEKRTIDDDGRHDSAIKDYSTDIAAAWEVVDKMIEDKEFSFNMMLHNTMGYKIAFTNESEDYHTIECCRHTIPIAICKAALKAKGIDIDE